MSEAVLVEFFVEDNPHEQLLVPLVERVAREEGIGLQCRVRNARGGHARAMLSFERYQILCAKGVVGRNFPALLVVAIDGNCSSFKETSRDVRRSTRDPFMHMLVTACPDPHIERWFLADPWSFQTVVGSLPKGSRRKCARDHYNQLLASAVAAAGHPAYARRCRVTRWISSGRARMMHLSRRLSETCGKHSVVRPESRGSGEQAVRAATGLWLGKCRDYKRPMLGAT